MPLPSMKVNIPSRELSVSTPTKQRNQPQRVILFALSNPPVARRSSKKMVSCAFIKLHLQAESPDPAKLFPPSRTNTSGNALVASRQHLAGIYGVGSTVPSANGAPSLSPGKRPGNGCGNARRPVGPRFKRGEAPIYRAPL